MRVVSLVPSLTETLAECGVNLAARTRFCVHPKEAMKRLPAIGGTKDLNREKLQELKPDLLIVDKEENLPWMVENAPCRVFVSHITSIRSAALEFRRLAAEFTGEEKSRIEQISERYDNVAAAKPESWDSKKIPGTLEVLRAPKGESRLEYIIWKNPWMKIGPDTYIHDVLKKLGASALIPNDGPKYPSFEISELPEDTLLLFSSEPYPFEKAKDEIRKLGHASVLIDGESYSWFGIRSLQFLEKNLKI